MKKVFHLAGGKSPPGPERVLAAMRTAPTVPEEEGADPEVDVVVGGRHDEDFASWFEHAVDFLDDLLGVIDTVVEAADADDINAAGFQGHGCRLGLDEVALQAAQLEIATNQFKLRARRTADNDRRPVLSVLHPVGAESVTDAEQGFAAMLGEFEQFRNPSAVLAVTLVFDIEVPLQRIRLGLLGNPRTYRRRRQGFQAVELLGKIVRIVRPLQMLGPCFGRIGVRMSENGGERLCGVFPQLQLEGKKVRHRLGTPFLRVYFRLVMQGLACRAFFGQAPRLHHHPLRQSVVYGTRLAFLVAKVKTKWDRRDLLSPRVALEIPHRQRYAGVVTERLGFAAGSGSRCGRAVCTTKQQHVLVAEKIAMLVHISRLTATAVLFALCIYWSDPSPSQEPPPIRIESPQAPGEIPKGIEVQARGPIHEAFASPM